jgi:pteridine reductase
MPRPETVFPMPSSSRVAFVTGGTSRIGRAIVLELAAAGIDIAFTFHRAEQQAQELVATVQNLKRQCVAVCVDFAVPDSVTFACEQVMSAYGRLDILVNNASIFAATPIDDVSVTEYEHFMRINAIAPMLLIQRLAERLGAGYRSEDPTSSGRVINFVDIHVLGEPLPQFLAYNASKAALLELTKTLAVELAPRITVNAIAPGVVGWAEFHTDGYKDGYLQRVPLAREGQPSEVARAALFLATDATYCTGQVIRLDGGRFLT